MFSHCHVVLSVLFFVGAAQCVTVYGPQGVIAFTASTTTTSTAPGTASTGSGAAAFNQVVLQPPPVPQPPPPTQFNVQLPDNTQGVQGLSIPHGGDFLGFSIEMSVVERVGMRLPNETFATFTNFEIVGINSWARIVPVT